MAKPSLAIDGGTPPPPVDEHDDQVVDVDAGIVAAAGPGGDVEDPGWTRETVRSLVAVPFLFLHVMAARRGPDDAWLPDDGELDVMAAPLHNMIARSVRLRPLAKFGDGIAFATATGTYTVAESRRIARWRAEYVPAEPPPAPDHDLSGIGTRAFRVGELIDHGADDPELRPWRPPSVPHE